MRDAVADKEREYHRVRRQQGLRLAHGERQVCLPGDDRGLLDAMRVELRAGFFDVAPDFARACFVRIRTLQACFEPQLLRSEARSQRIGFRVSPRALGAGFVFHLVGE